MARQKTAGQEPAVSGTEDAAVVASSVELEFPRTATLRNNSPIPLVETYTGAYLGAGSASEITLHDAEQLENVRQNLAALAACNYFDPALLVIDGLPG